MNQTNLWRTIIRGFALILLAIYLLFRKCWDKFRKCLSKICSQKKEPAKEKCCIRIPDAARAQPDPFIYSQEWLMQRGFSVTWDNPDFQVIDEATGMRVNRFDLQPNHTYRVEVTLHNNSIMAAIATQLQIDIHPFGISSGTLLGSSLITGIDIPAFGSIVTHFRWLTPPQVGHICLKAKIIHGDDANPANNLGQHNTVIVAPQENGDTEVKFRMHNKYESAEKYTFHLDSFRLPAEVSLPKTMEQRNSLQYLRQLQDRYSPLKYALNASALNIRLDGLEMERDSPNGLTVRLQGKQELTGTIIIPNSVWSGLSGVLNVTVFSEGGQLAGGFTIIQHH